jgi:glutathionylspermidine synthase
VDEFVFGGAIKDGGRAMKNWKLQPNGKLFYTLEPQSLAILFAQAQRRKIISDTLNELHSMQFNMIEEAVSKSDMAESKTVIAHIMGMK